MKNKWIFTGLAACFALSANAQNLKPFEEGDRVAFLGNSITEAGYYLNDIWLYYMTHFPDRRIEVMNAGIGGDTAELMNARFEDDVLRLNPTDVVLTFGMNDSGYFEYNNGEPEKVGKEKADNSYKYFVELQKKFKANPDITPIIMSSSPYDYSAEIGGNNFNGKKETMDKIVAFQQKDAKANGWNYVDLYHPMLEITQREQKKDPKYTITGPDRIHPGKPGHLVMAALFLKEQGLANIPVADVALDAAKSKVDKAENAKITLINSSKTGMSFNYMANALPFPIDSINGVWGNDHKQNEALDVYPFIKEFDREMLKVNNLKKGNYVLSIDGEKIATFSADSLSKGINLAVLGTPQYKQARNIMYLNDLRAEIENKVRQYYWVQFNYLKAKSMLFDDSQKAVDAVVSEREGFIPSKAGYYKTIRYPEVMQMYQDDMKQVTNMIYELNKPKMHVITISPSDK